MNWFTRTAVAVALSAALSVGLAACEQGSTWIQTTCKLDDQAAAPCDYDWQTMTGSVSYAGLPVGHHVVVVEARRCTLVSKDPDVGKCSPWGSATREWDVVPAAS